MEAVLVKTGRLVGAFGVLTVLVAVVARLSGFYWVAGFQTGTVLLAGMAAMLAGCLAFLAALTSQGAAGGP